MSATILISNLGVDDDDYHDDLVFSSLSKVFKSYPDNGEMIYAIKYQLYCHELKRVTDGFSTKIKANITYDAQCMKRDLMYFWRKLHTHLHRQIRPFMAFIARLQIQCILYICWQPENAQITLHGCGPSLWAFAYGIRVFHACCTSYNKWPIFFQCLITATSSQWYWSKYQFQPSV